MEFTITQQIIMGLIQGISEWLPISSSAMLTLFMTNILGITDMNQLLQSALFLHLGTFFAALIYFHKDIIKLTKSFFNWKKSNSQDKAIIKFLIITTLISGIFGIIILKLLSSINLTGKVITFTIAILLLFTGFIQIKIKNKGLKKETNLKNKDSILLGFSQGLATLPGVSRSGITVSTLLLRKFDDTTSLKLSFLMSLPIVFLGNILLNLSDLQFITSTAIYGLLASFIFGLL
ncbi:MAG: undecaprenyl-diphosphate phosphatase, partial [Candidatus Pacearchaeota archaeon]|nr:undecaprenyl-diphosphate phosphatase [Candidatus Pacearchaeota archaeon]